MGASFETEAQASTAAVAAWIGAYGEAAVRTVAEALAAAQVCACMQAWCHSDCGQEPCQLSMSICRQALHCGMPSSRTSPVAGLHVCSAEHCVHQDTGLTEAGQEPNRTPGVSACSSLQLSPEPAAEDRTAEAGAAEGVRNTAQQAKLQDVEISSAACVPDQLASSPEQHARARAPAAQQQPPQLEAASNAPTAHSRLACQRTGALQSPPAAKRKAADQQPPGRAPQQAPAKMCRSSRLGKAAPQAPASQDLPTLSSTQQPAQGTPGAAGSLRCQEQPASACVQPQPAPALQAGTCSGPQQQQQPQQQPQQHQQQQQAASLPGQATAVTAQVRHARQQSGPAVWLPPLISCCQP